MSSALLDMDALNESRATFKAKFPTMVEYYFEDAEGYVGAIRSAIAQSSVPGIVAPAHTLKSSSRQMGAALLSNIAKDVEAAARDQSQGLPWFSEQLAKLEDAFAQTRTTYPKE